MEEDLDRKVKDVLLRLSRLQKGLVPTSFGVVQVLGCSGVNGCEDEAE